MGKLDNDFGVIFWAHLSVIIIFILTPFFLPYYIIFCLVILFYIQNLLFKNCILTKAQLKNKEGMAEDESSFFVYYFKKIGLPVNAKKIKKYFAWFILWTVFIFSLFWQLDLGKSPLWFK